ncbi:MAG: hypothetical protein ACYC8T_02735 [Myxococcaceae bacterium]
MTGSFLSSEALQAVSGSSISNVYVTADSGKIYRSTGGAFSSVVYTDASNRSINGLYVTPDGKVFAGGPYFLVHCLSGCAAQGDFTSVALTSPNSTEIFGVCGGGGQVFAVGNNGSYSRGTAFKFNFGTQVWDVFSQDTGVTNNRGCWVAPNGDLYVAAQGRVVRIDSAGSAFQESINPVAPPATETITGLSLRAIWGSGTTVFATGTRRRIIQRRANATWDFVFTPPENNGYDFYALGGASPNELLASGFSFGGQHWAKWNGTTWTFGPDLPLSLDVYGIWAANVDTYYLVGQRHNSWLPSVLRATR